MSNRPDWLPPPMFEQAPATPIGTPHALQWGSVQHPQFDAQGQPSPVRALDWRSDRPVPVTLTFPAIWRQDDQQGPALLNNVFPARVNLEWGHAGVIAQATIDYPWRGGTVTVTASTVKASLWLDGVSSWTGSSSVQKDVDFGVFISEGVSRPDATPPTYTFENLGPPPNPVPVPRHARAYYIDDNVDLAPIGVDTRCWNISVNNRGPGGINIVDRVDVQGYLGASSPGTRTGPNAAHPLPLPARSTHLNLSRQAGYGPPTKVEVVFILDLGA